MEKAKRALHPKKAITNRKKGGLIPKLELYLASDSHMFAPFFSPHNTTSPSPTFSSFAVSPGLKRKEPVGGRKKQFLEKVVAYLMSDMYMYATLVSPQPIAPHLDGSTKFQYTRKVTTEITTHKMTVEDRRWPARNSIQRDEHSKDSGTGISDKITNLHREKRNRIGHENGEPQ